MQSEQRLYPGDPDWHWRLVTGTVEERDPEAMTSRLSEAPLPARAGALQRAISNSTNYSSIATDAKGVIQIFNVGAERMLGYAAADVLNQVTPAHIADPVEVVALAAALSLEFSTPVAPGFEALAFKASRGIEDSHDLTYIRKDGSRFPAVVSVTALRDARHSIIGYLLIGTDNTAHKQIEEERTKRCELMRQRKNAELEAANRTKSEFLASMSHELRTPLNAIIGFSEVLKDGLLGDMTDQQRGRIGDIFNSGKHLLVLINDMLDLSEVESGKMLLHFEVVAVEALLRSSLSMVREKAVSRQVFVSMQLGELGCMRADGRKLKQIIHNLLANALKFSAEGGQVVLRANVVPRARVGQLSGPWPGRGCRLAQSDALDFLELSVSDTGIGILPEDLEKLFQPFDQIDSGLARKFEGAGLGLAMVKLLAELHGGTVAAESAVGEGSRFTVWLPFCAVAIPAPNGETVRA